MYDLHLLPEKINGTVELSPHCSLIVLKYLLISKIHHHSDTLRKQLQCLPFTHGYLLLKKLLVPFRYLRMMFAKFFCSGSRQEQRGVDMAVKSKKSRPQRSSRERSSERISGKRNGKPTLSGNKRRRTDDENNVERTLAVTPTPLSSALPPLPENGNQRGSLSNRGCGKGARKVLTPPRSRRPSRTTGGSRSPPSSAALDKHLATGLKAMATDSNSGAPSDSSDDCEVYEIQRVPLDDNPFYKEYMRKASGGLVRGALDASSGSPITPASLKRNETEEGTHFQDGEARIDLSRQRNEGVIGGSSPVSGFPSPVDRGLTASREMLSSFYKDLAEMMNKGMAGQRELISSRMDRFENVQAKLVSEINEMRVVCSVGRNGATSHSRTTPLSRYEIKLDDGTPHAEWVFDLDTISRTLRMNLTHAIVSIAGERGNFVDNVSIAVRAILFGLHPSQKRSAFSVGVGRRHSAFRYSVVMNILCNVQHNRFKKFSAGGAGDSAIVVNSSNEDDQVHESPSDPVVRQIKQPKWLEPGFIGPRHVEEARMRVEANVAALDSGSQQEPIGTKHKKAWITVKETPDKGDIARYGALKVYRFVTTGLYYAREKAKWVLFEELTYIMTTWEGDVDQRCLRVAWGYEGTEVAEVDLSSVATCKKRSTDPAHADEYNTSTFAEFLSARKEMVLCVSHCVKIRPNGSSARHKRGVEERILERAINLVDVAAKFCVVFTQQAMGGFSKLPFLGAHEDSLK